MNTVINQARNRVKRELLEQQIDPVAYMQPRWGKDVAKAVLSVHDSSALFCVPVLAKALLVPEYRISAAIKRARNNRP